MDAPGLRCLCRLVCAARRTYRRPARSSSVRPMSRWTLPPNEIPTAWFNVTPHLPTPLQPPLHPGTREPIGPDDLAPLFPMALIGQEVSTEPWIDVPGEVLDILRLWRPTPLVRAVRLEKALGTPARIYFKDESVSPAGSHKPNTAVPQAFYNKAEGISRLATETGAGQWGTALAFACAQFDLECKVYMVRASYQQKPYRKVIMETWGGSVVPSPVDDPDHPGSLGAAISDAVRDAVGRADTHYALGSVLNHVLLHQTVIGLEAKEQLGLAGERLPDVVIAPCGGGSNLGGIAFPFVPDAGVRLVAVEPLSCPTLTEGTFEYDFGDTAGLTPLLPMYTLGHNFVPPSIHAGGLRYHGDSPIISALVRDGRMEAVAYPQGKVFEAAVQFARTEGKVAAPEAAHAIRAVIDEALAARETGEEKVILFNYCGHGFLDLSAYEDYLAGRLPDEQGS
ncbi:MAG: tryptophan synthase beta chain [Pseudonocardiales bacterium]|nr:tryptophan synthase beta chain [Pseudonocardiales bacterium]